GRRRPGCRCPRAEALGPLYRNLRAGGGAVMAIALTASQQRLLDMISSHIAATGTAPTVEEMRQALGVQSKSSVHNNLVALEKRGAIRRLPLRARAIEIVEPQCDALDAVLA